MGYRVVHAHDLPWEERTPPQGRENDPARLAADLTPSAQMRHSRARLWRYPPGSRGRRHAEKVQEEVFVVLEGTLTMHLGEPPEQVELAPHSVVAVEPGTPLQLRNDGTEDVLLFAYGAPPVAGIADLLDDAAP